MTVPGGGVVPPLVTAAVSVTPLYALNASNRMYHVPGAGLLTRQLSAAEGVFERQSKVLDVGADACFT
jgi:hypothetical protein